MSPHVVVPNTVTFRHVGEWHGANSAVLESRCRLGEVEVDGVDMVDWNGAGQITRLKVMVRPFRAPQSLMTLMAAELARS